MIKLSLPFPGLKPTNWTWGRATRKTQSCWKIHRSSHKSFWIHSEKKTLQEEFVDVTTQHTVFELENSKEEECKIKLELLFSSWKSFKVVLTIYLKSQTTTTEKCSRIWWDCETRIRTNEYWINYQNQSDTLWLLDYFWMRKTCGI